MPLLFKEMRALALVFAPSFFFLDCNMRLYCSADSESPFGGEKRIHSDPDLFMFSSYADRMPHQLIAETWTFSLLEE